MMPLSLVRAEWLKTRKRLLNRGMLVLPVLLVAGILGLLVVLGLARPDEFRGDAEEVVPYPGNTDLAIALLNQIGIPLVVVFVATSVGAEYGRDTWKAIVPRYGSRAAFLLSKWVVGLAALLILVASVLGLAIALGWGGARLLGVTPDPGSGGDPAGHLRTVAELLLEFVFIGTITLCGTVIARSTIGGVISGIVVPTVLVLARDVLPLLRDRQPLLTAAIAWLLPTTHFANLQDRWVTPVPSSETLMAILLGHPVSPGLSALVVLIQIGLLLGASLYLFSRRDMAGG